MSFYHQESVEAHSQAPGRSDKGKGRALEPTERTPLLGSTSTGLGALHEAVIPENSHNRNLWSKLRVVFLVSLLLCVLGSLLLFFLAWSYAAKAASLRLEDAIQDGYLVIRGPDHVSVANVTRLDENQGVEIHVDVDGRVGVDAGAGIGVNRDEDDGLLMNVWKAVGRWGVKKLGKITVELSSISLSSEHDLDIVLLHLHIPPLELPLSVDPPGDASWLTPVSLSNVRVILNTNNNVLLEFLKDSWKHGSMVVRARVGRANIRGGPLSSNEYWRGQVRKQLRNIRIPIHIRLPSIPGLPHPGQETPFPSIGDLIHLKSFHVFSEHNTLRVHASASIVNPAPPTLDLAIPSLPFTVSLPYNDDNALELASVTTFPARLNAHTDATISMNGSVLPISKTSFPVLSDFVSRFLSGKPNTVLITSPLIPPKSGIDTIQATFPAPHPRPQVLHDVTIRDMKIRPTGTGPFLASGTVVARLVLPKGIDIGLEVKDLFPDLLIYDGELPIPLANVTSVWPHRPGSHWHKGHKHGNEDDHDNNPDLPPNLPIPDPLPELAFAHIKPEDWVPALSLREDGKDSDYGASYAISAKVVDVPLEVLPGRQKEFSNFVGKVIFGSEGATAGLQGIAAVILKVEGLPVYHSGKYTGMEEPEVMLSGLPFQGNVHIGKKAN